MPIGIDNAGKYIYPGRVARKVIDEPFYSGTLPATLTVPNGTGAYGNATTGDGAYTLTTAATASAVANMKTAAGFATSGSKAILFELDGLYFSSQSVQVDMSIAASGSVGAVIRQSTADTTAKVIVGGATTSIDFQLINGGNQAGNKRDLGLMIIPATKEVIILENGEIAYTFTGASFVGGVASPEIKVTTTNAAAQTAKFLQARVTLFQN